MQKYFTILGVIVILVIAGLFLLDNDTSYERPDGAATTSDAQLSPLELADATVTLDGVEETFGLADDFSINVAAEGLGKVRFMAESPDGRIFVPDLVDYNLSHNGRLFILDDFNEETGEFETQHTYLSGLRGANSVAFYTDENGQDWLYLALTEHLLRYPYEAGDTEPSGDPEVVVEFPNTQTPGETSVVWHITRTVKFHNDRMYIAIGSGCNSCEQQEDVMRGMIVSMTPEGEDIQTYADGLRNAVGFDWARNTLYVTENGADHLGPDRPDGVMYQVEEGEHYGWPYCYETDGELVPDTTQEWSDPIPCEELPESLASFPPRSAPLGITYFADAHEALEGSFLVALHGSFDQAMRSGYEVRRVTPDGQQEVFMDGFQRSESNERIARPIDFLQHDEDSFFMTDDHGGRIFYISAN